MANQYGFDPDLEERVRGAIMAGAPPDEAIQRAKIKQAERAQKKGENAFNIPGVTTTGTTDPSAYTTPSPTQTTPNTFGREQYTQALAKDLAETGGERGASIQRYYDAANPKKTPEEVAADKEAKAMEMTKQSAQTVLDIIAKGKTGELTGQQYQDALQQAASDYSSARAFAAGGKNVTQGEKALLAGALLRTEEPRTQNFFQKTFTGYVPPATGKILDPEETIVNKMNYILGKQATQQPQKSAEHGYSLGGLIKNAGGELAELADTPYNISQMEKTTGTRGQYAIDQASKGNYGELLKFLIPGIAGAQAVGEEANQFFGEPLKGPGTLNRALNRAYEKPLTTVADIMAVKGVGNMLKSPKVGLPETPSAIPGEAPSTNIVQKGAQATTKSMSDLINGGGSKEYIARQATSPNPMPRNQVLMEENILVHPTETGQIQATAKAMKKYGSQIGETYKSSKSTFKTSDLVKTLEEKLIGRPPEEIKSVIDSLSKRGKFDLTTGDTSLNANELWNVAKDLGKTAEKNPGSVSAQAEAILRGELSQAHPELSTINSKYSALADFMYETLESPKGLAGTGGLPNLIAKGIKGVSNPILNAAYKATTPAETLQEIVQGLSKKPGVTPSIPASLPETPNLQQVSYKAKTLTGTALDPKGKVIKSESATLKFPRKEQIKVKKLPPTPKYMWR